jgi:hypothetical protein
MIVIDASAIVEALVGRDADDELLDALQTSVRAPHLPRAFSYAVMVAASRGAVPSRDGRPQLGQLGDERCPATIAVSVCSRSSRLSSCGSLSVEAARKPGSADIFDVDDSSADRDRVDIGVRLLQTATAEVVPASARPPEYVRIVPPDWREAGVTRRVVEDRMVALVWAGTRLLVERLRLEWRPGTLISEPSGRLAFRPVRDTEEILALVTLALDGTLDAHSRGDLTARST